MTGSLQDYEALLIDKDRLRKEQFQNRLTQNGVLAEKTGKKTTAVGTDMEDVEFYKEEVQHDNSMNQLYVFNNRLLSLSDAETFKLLSSQRGFGCLKSGELHALHEMNAIEEEIGSPGTPCTPFVPYKLLTPLKNTSIFDQQLAESTLLDGSPHQRIVRGTPAQYGRMLSADRSGNQSKEIINLSIPVATQERHVIKFHAKKKTSQPELRGLINEQYWKYQEHELSCVEVAGSKKYIKIRGITPKNKEGQLHSGSKPRSTK